MKAILAIAVMTACAGLGIVSHAHAGGSAITTPGAACVLQGSQAQDDQQALQLNQQGAANGDPQREITIVCPVVRSSEGGTLGIFVDGIEGDGDAHVFCRVQSRSIRGEFLAQKTFTTTKSPFSIPSLFTFGEAPVFSYQTVICELPPKARIHGITALEK